MCIRDRLKESLSESIRCYRSRANTASVLMCRKTIESFCHIKESKERDLSKSLLTLKNNGHINEQLYEWANELRLSGNEAAHDIHSKFSKKDARDILDFTIAILDFSYSFKTKFDEFKARRIVSNTKNTAP